MGVSSSFFFSHAPIAARLFFCASHARRGYHVRNQTTTSKLQLVHHPHQCAVRVLCGISVPRATPCGVLSQRGTVHGYAVPFSASFIGCSTSVDSSHARTRRPTQPVDTVHPRTARACKAQHLQDGAPRFDFASCLFISAVLVSVMFPREHLQYCPAF